MNYCKSENIMATAVSMLTFFFRGEGGGYQVNRELKSFTDI